MMGMAFVGRRHHVFEPAFDLERRLAGRQPGAIADAENMRIDRNRGFVESDV